MIWARRFPADLRGIARVREKKLLTLGSPLRPVLSIILVVFAVTMTGCPKPEEATVEGEGRAAGDGEIGGSFQAPGSAKPLKILSPFDEALFPPDIVAPTFRWEDLNSSSDKWLIEFRFQDGPGMDFESRSTEWTVPDEAWETIKQRSLESTADVTIRAVSDSDPDNTVSRDSVSIGTSKDAVDAPLFFREVILPFNDAVKDPSRIRWRFGKISSKQQPPVILEGLPVCGNCHSFSADGSVLGMDVDYANDKGSYAIVPVAEDMTIGRGQVINWSDFEKSDDEATFGLLSQVSPDGRYVISTVKDRSVFVARDNLAFSQLFFPIKGILVFYDRLTKEFHPLPGADDPRLVQSNPTWSPDGEYVIFARSKVHHLKKARTSDSFLLREDECAEFLKEGKKFLFDLYRVPFNDGKGGKAEPIDGASNNGMSNYFPKFSPDGKWIVFCKARSFMLLQPDSQLYIVPAEGGQARRLECNTSRMNSWHSWAPNGNWLVFSSKEYSAYTQLFLTQIDERGHSSVPVVLSRFTAPERAANIPEFVNLKPEAIKRISADFLDDRNYYRAAMAFLDKSDKPGAVPLLRKSLEVNPENAASRLELATILADSGKTDEARLHLAKVFERSPDELEPKYFTEAHCCLASILHGERRLSEAMEHFDKAIQLSPEHLRSYINAAVVLIELGRLDEATVRLERALELDPTNSHVHGNLGVVLVRRGRLDEAIAHLQMAVKLDAECTEAHTNLGKALMKVGRLEEATEHFRITSELDAEDPLSHFDLGNVLLARGMLEEAVACFKKSVEIKPQFVDGRLRLGNLLAAQGLFGPAVAELQEAVAVAPDNPKAINDLAWLLAVCQDDDIRDGARAIELIEPACRNTDYRVPLLLSTLAAAYAETGRFSDAIATADKALGLVKPENEYEAKRIRQHLEFYRRNAPFRYSLNAPPE